MRLLVRQPPVMSASIWSSTPGAPSSPIWDSGYLGVSQRNQTVESNEIFHLVKKCQMTQSVEQPSCLLTIIV